MYKNKMTVWHNGEEIELLTIGAVAKILKRSTETIRQWERNGIIPKPLYRKNGIRLYHPKEVAVMKQVIKKMKMGAYARQDELKETMWQKLAEIRSELINGKKKSDEV